MYVDAVASGRRWKHTQRFSPHNYGCKKCCDLRDESTLTLGFPNVLAVLEILRTISPCMYKQQHTGMFPGSIAVDFPPPTDYDLEVTAGEEWILFLQVNDQFSNPTWLVDPSVYKFYHGYEVKDQDVLLIQVMCQRFNYHLLICCMHAS